MTSEGHPVKTHLNPASWWSVFIIFLRLGLTSFGGPIAHLGYFQKEFVQKRAWMTASEYADLVALCQFLPGPASSQVGIGLGLLRAGIPGSIAAFLGFTLPSAVVMGGFALVYEQLWKAGSGGFLHGFQLVSVAVVAQALWTMAKSFSQGWIRSAITVFSAIGIIVLPPTIGQIIVITLAAFLGLTWLHVDVPPPSQARKRQVSTATAIFSLSLFFALLAGLPLLAHALPVYPLQLIDCFFRTGALVFGGGHVVLPLLETQVVQHGWVTQDAFLVGYGATQAMPGPLFTFAAFLGAMSSQTPSGWIGATIAIVAIFLPAFLLVIGAMPFWEQIRHHQVARDALSGINAGVVGMLLAAFYHPIWTSAILTPRDFFVAITALLLLTVARLPAWLTVIMTVTLSGLFLS